MSNANLQIGFKANEMSQHIHNKNWSDTPLGPLEKWPQSIRSALNICLISDSPASICWGNDLIFIYNDAWKNLLGDKHLSLLGQPAREVFEDSWQIFESNFEEVISTGEVKRISNQPLSFAGGEVGHFNFFLSPISGTNNSVDGIFSIATESAGYRQNESQLSQREQQSTDFFENAPIGIHWLGQDGTIIKANQAELDMLGYSREEYIGRNISEFHVDQDLIEDKLQKLSEGEELQGCEAQMRCKDGSIRDVLISSNVARKGDEFIHSRCFTRDITDRKRWEQSLQKSERRYRTLVENFPNGAVGLFDEDLRYTAVGGKLLDVANVDSEDRIGNKITDIYPDELVDEVEPYFRAVFEGETNSFEAELHDQYLFALTLPVENEDGDTIAGMLVVLNITERRQSQQELRKNEKKYRTLFESMDEGFCLIKMLFDEDDNPVDYRFLEVNSSFEKHTGLENVEGKTAREVHTDLKDSWYETYGDVALTGEPAQFERYIRELERWLDVSAFRMGEPEERKVAVLFNNVTNRKENEFSNAYLSAIVENSDDAIISKDLEGYITSWNESAEEMFGYTAEEAIDQHITIIIPDNRLEEEEKILGRLKRGDEIDNYETMREHKNGTLLDVSLTISPVRDSAGEIVGASKIARDITDRKQIREERERLFRKVETERERLSEIFQQAPSFMCILRGPNHVFERANDYYRELVGDRELIGKPIAEATPEMKEQGLIDLLDEVYETGEPFRAKDMEVKLRRNPDQPAEKHFLNFVYQPLRDTDGSITGIFVQGVDLTERHHAREELKAINETLEERVRERTKELRSYQKQLQSLASQLNKAEERERQRLASELHDKLGQMLTVAKMKVDGLQHDHFSDQISTDIEELKKVVDDALNYNQNLMVELKPPPALDREDVTEVLYWTARKMEKQGLDITIEDDGQPKPVDKEIRSMLHQSVRELFQNVIKHSDVNEARMILSREKDHVKITIKDKGRGFDIKENRPQPTEEGGFGLFNIQERIDWHGGTFEIYSQPGKGTKIVLYAPLKDQETLDLPASDDEDTFPPSAEKEEQFELGQKIRVLLVDDHEMVRKGLHQMIEKQEDLTIVAEASNGQEAVDLAHEMSPDIIVMDVNMPVMGGIEATQKIKGDMSGVRIIGLSLHDSQEVIQDMQNAGASAYLTKDEAFESLVGSIRAEASARSS